MQLRHQNQEQQEGDRARRHHQQIRSVGGHGYKHCTGYSNWRSLNHATRKAMPAANTTTAGAKRVRHHLAPMNTSAAPTRMAIATVKPHRMPAPLTSPFEPRIQARAES